MKTDIEKLIKQLLSSSLFTDEKVYRDEPIVFTGREMLEQMPAQYRKMRMIARENLYNSAAKIFYEQGKFMEDFEDDYKYEGEFVRYYPTYQDMSDRQLRGYFSWRTKIRHGIFNAAPVPFAFIYMYELINMIGVKTTQEGFEKLRAFCEAYTLIDGRIKRYADTWIVDYAVYYGLDRSVLDGLVEDSKQVLHVLNDCASASPEKLLEALCSVSNYNITRSAFYKKYPQRTENVVYGAYERLCSFYERYRKNSFSQKLLGRITSYEYRFFDSAVFCNRLKIRDFMYELTPYDRYICNSGVLRRERFVPERTAKAKTGALLRTIDSLLREEFEFQPALKPGEVPQLYIDFIHEQIKLQKQREKEEQKKVIALDLSKLAGIRSSSETTQRLLCTEQEDEEETNTSQEQQRMDGASPDGSGLTPDELFFIGCLLGGGDVCEQCRQKGIAASVAADAVNDRLFDMFSDSVIEFDADKPQIIPDYLDALEALWKKETKTK